MAGEHGTLTGEVAGVVFRDAETGFGVVELASPGSDEGARAAGPLAALVPGQAVRLTGRWTDSERYGPTFEAVAYERAHPSSDAGLTTFLSSERFPGVGAVRAQRLVDAFGRSLPDVAANAPHRLAEVAGISPALARSIGERWRGAGSLAGLVAELTAAGVPAAVAVTAQRTFGAGAAEVLGRDPYALLEVRGARWAHAEMLARAAKVDRLDERRLAAGAAAAQRERCWRGGHMATPADEVVAEATRLLGVDAVDARRGVDRAVATGVLAVDRDLVWRAADLAAETTLAAALTRLLAARSGLPAALADRPLDPDLTDEQQRAVRSALTRPVSVLSGGPGTGKTRTVVALAAVCEEAGLNVALCAPTGRAAKRIEEMTGRSASTVHRLLEARGRTDQGSFAFGYGDDRRLPFDVVVADEWSMADTALAAALASAVPDGAHLLLVGDADQLPSVGPGAVMRDLLDDRLSALVPSVRLTRIHRQAAASRIVTLAHEINRGAVPPLAGRDADVFVVPEHPAHLADRVAEIVAVRAPAFYGCPPAAVQVLAPMYRGGGGVDRLNERLKERLNPAGGRRAVAGFHEGDRVVQTRNDAELEVANGDIGEVVATDPSARSLSVAFPTGVVTYDAARAGDLAPAWCLTVHKAQGGEWPVVVLVLDPAHRTMLWRELVYTAVTRAREGLLLVGDARLVGEAAGRLGSGARRRRTCLAARLEDAVVPTPAGVPG